MVQPYTKYLRSAKKDIDWDDDEVDGVYSYSLSCYHIAYFN